MVNELDIEVAIIEKGDGTNFKRDFIQKIGNNETIAIGNGNNDRLMLEEQQLELL